MCLLCPTLHESFRFTFLYTSCRIGLSFCLSSSLFFWRYVVVTRFTKVSLSASQSLCVSARLCLSPSFCGLTPFRHYCRDSVPICLSLSEFLSISPSFLLPFSRLMVFGCDRSRVNLCISFCRLSFSLLLMFFFHQSGAGSEKAVHHGIAGDEHHVPVNTRPLAMLSHLVSSSRLLCYSLLIFLKY